MRLSILLLVLGTLLSCTANKPEDYFNRAILNTNLLVSFIGDGMQRELASPSSRLNKDGSIGSMTAAEVLEMRADAVRESLKKVRGLEVTDETKAMLQTSIALHETVLESADGEYAKLAKLYDSKASQDVVDAEAARIAEKYHARMATLHNSLISIGKVYAAAHEIPVQWDVQTSPR